MSPKKFRRKIVVFEAMQYDGTNGQEILDWMASEYAWDFEDSLLVRTPNGNVKVEKGDYIIKSAKGGFCPCDRDLFEDIYEPLEQSTKTQII
jgi:hypothetical protein